MTPATPSPPAATGSALVLFVLAMVAVWAHTHWAYHRGIASRAASLALDGPLLVSRFLIGGVFIVAACLKLVDPVRFAEDIHNFHIVSDQAAVVMAVLLPYIELVAGCACLLGVRGRAGALLLSVLLAVFTIAVGIAIAKGIDISCGCLGKGDTSRTNLAKVFHNLALLMPGLHIVILGPGAWTLDTLFQRAFTPKARSETEAEPAA